MTYTYKYNIFIYKLISTEKPLKNRNTTKLLHPFQGLSTYSHTKLNFVPSNLTVNKIP